ncbi:MAG TPA: S1C family serine protease [Armatimonadota bacterium]|nr:S1C family serine protease [Armatimonadota bacterium]
MLTMRSVVRSIIGVLTVIVFSMTMALAQELKPEDIYRQSLPSIMTVIAETPEGISYATGFAANKEGIVITTWHVLNSATKVTVRFANGEEFESQGLIDKDEQHDIAIFRIKKYGTPLLPYSKDDPSIGTPAYTIGSPKGLEFTFSNGIFSQIQKIDGVRNYQFTCAISPGNSGGPLLNSKGETVGVVDWGIHDGQNLNFAIPMTYVLALDTTLPTKPWSTAPKISIPEPKVANTPPQPVATNAAANATTNAATDDKELDKALGDGVTLYQDSYGNVSYLHTFIYGTSGKYNDGIPTFVYQYQRKVSSLIKVLESCHSTVPERENLRKLLISNLAIRSEYLNGKISAIKCAQKEKCWGVDAKDLDKQAEAVLVDLNSDLVAPIQQLAKISKTFVENINTDYQCSFSVTCIRNNG